MTNIKYSVEMHKILMGVENPVRYVGGEAFSTCKDDAAVSFRIALSFPDVYEIGMSNNSIKILYTFLNKLTNIQCERVFAPLPDFESALRTHHIPLYTLENGVPLNECDMIAFSVGYELTLTNMMNIMSIGGVSPLRVERGKDSPLVISGGPAVTNPHPFGPFCDAVCIGEAEAVLPQIVNDLAEIKKRGGDKDDQLERIRNEKSFWYHGKQVTTERAVWRGFGKKSFKIEFPLPNCRIIQDQGVVEIMRGCPGGCRFCHAGIYYRPMRVKKAGAVMEEVSHLIDYYGYRDITLSSLSSGDYPDIDGLIQRVNGMTVKSEVSIALPSLRVDSFTLPIIESLSQGKKSGLTFAVETPLHSGQIVINKIADKEKIIAILKKAVEQKWRVAKFYFMVGLPLEDSDTEADDIIQFLLDVRKEVPISINVNIGTFIPKPHTPFQWAKQLSEFVGLDRIMQIRKKLGKKSFKVGYHSPFASLLEGIVSRGDERAGMMFYDAFLKGARLDAWEEHLDRDFYRQLINEQPWDVQNEICRERSVDEILPWDDVNLGVKKRFLLKEYERAGAEISTKKCSTNCRYPCGVCGDDFKVQEERGEYPDVKQREISDEGERFLLLLKYRKTGKAVYISHLGVISVFERALIRSSLPVRFTQGFNRKPKMEFAQPLSLGYSSEYEVLGVELSVQKYDVIEKDIQKLLKTPLPEGLSFLEYHLIPLEKKVSLMANLFDIDYQLNWHGDDVLEWENFLNYLKNRDEIELQKATEKSCMIIWKANIEGGKGLPKIIKDANICQHVLKIITKRLQLHGEQRKDYLSYLIKIVK
jgi:radical SAM-linked protein